MPPDDAPGERMLELWNRLSPLPGGRRVYSWLLGRMVPYTGSMGAVVQELEPGRARVTLKDRRSIRNHLRSVHAVALANLGELTSGLALTTAVGGRARGIPVSLRMEYLKKARGLLTASSRVELPDLSREVDHEAVAHILDASGEVVARASVLWRLRPVP